MFDFDTIKQKILWYSDFINNYFKQNWKSLNSLKTLEEEFLEKEFWNEIEKYNQKTKEFNNYMFWKENELNEIEDKKRGEKAKLDTVSKKLKKNLELLDSENIILEEINSDLNEYKNVLLNFWERFNNSTKKIDELIEVIIKYEEIAKDDISDVLEKSKEDIKKYFDEEKENIQKFLEDKSKKVIEEKFNIEQLKLDQEKKESFHFEWKLFFKYILIFLLAFWIATIDFLLVQHIVVEEFDLWRNSDSSIRILVYYIIPFLPSFVLIFWEFLVLKYLKHNILLKWVVHLFSIISVLFIILTVFFTYQDLNLILVDNINMYDLLSRILIFVIAIPITIAILNKFFKTDEFFEFLRHLFLPIIFIFIFSKYFIESFILKDKKNKLFKEAFTYDLNVDKLDLFLNKNHKLDDLLSIPRTFNEDLNQVSIKTEKALDNIKNLQAFLQKDYIESTEKVWFFRRLFWFWKQKDNLLLWNVNWKIARLKQDIKIIWKDIIEQEELVDKKYQKDIDNINSLMSNKKKIRENYKKNYDSNRKNVEEAISSALSELK